MPKKKTEVETEIDEMLENYFPEGEETPQEPPVEKPPAEEPPVEEPPAEPPVEEPPGEEPPEGPPEEPPSEEPPIEEEETPEQELERLRNQNQLLIDRIEKGFETPSPKPVEEPPKPREEPPKTELPKAELPAEPEVIDFVKGRSLEDLIDTPEGLNTLLNDVFKEGLKRGSGKIDVEPVVERILNSLPGIVQTQVTQQTAINTMVREFYANNEDLGGVKRTVATFANEVYAEHPDWKTKDVFEEAGKRTRDALGFRAKATAAPASGKRPAFSRARGARKGGKEEPTGVQKDIDELINP